MPHLQVLVVYLERGSHHWTSLIQTWPVKASARYRHTAFQAIAYNFFPFRLKIQDPEFFKEDIIRKLGIVGPAWLVLVKSYEKKIGRQSIKKFQNRHLDINNHPQQSFTQVDSAQLFCFAGGRQCWAALALLCVSLLAHLFDGIIKSPIITHCFWPKARF